MKLNNYKIYENAQALSEAFLQSDLYIPVKANFAIQKNIKVMAAAGEEIEKSRIAVVSHYGTLDAENNQYIVPEEKIAEANKEINDLFSMEQDLDIKTIKLEDLGNIELTPKQMQALMFMIEE